MVWIIPTLSRPKQVQELLKQASELDYSEGIVFVNGGDHHKEYVELVGNHLPDGWEMRLHNENLGALGALNYIYNEYPDEDYYGFIGDDEFVFSEGWNTDLTEAAGSWSVSHANDGWQSESRIHSYVCIGGNLARTVGTLAVPTCWHWYGFDTMWEVIAQQIPIRRFLPKIETEHRHPLRHKVASDSCYELGQSKMKEDEAAFADWIRDELPSIVEKVKKQRLF